MMRLPPLLAALVILAGCAQESTEIRYPIPPVAAPETVEISYSAVEVRDVSLPAYAELSEMATATEDGGIRVSDDVLWADNPVRAITLELTRDLAQITGATVASEPWPFEYNPPVRVEVRVEELLAELDGEFRMSGQYFVASRDDPDRDKARLFSLTKPLGAGPGPAAMAEALARIVADLALLIARDGLN